MKFHVAMICATVLAVNYSVAAPKESSIHSEEDRRNWMISHRLTYGYVLGRLYSEERGPWFGPWQVSCIEDEMTGYALEQWRFIEAAWLSDAGPSVETLLSKAYLAAKNHCTESYCRDDGTVKADYCGDHPFTE